MSRLLERLREGPLRLDDFAQVSASKGSLKVLVHKLRERGFDIVSVPLANGNRRPKVEYRLNVNRCPCCKQVIA